jgi:NhaA family Na+:H+ antiporter
MIAAVVALVWANTAPATYAAVWQQTVTVGGGSLVLSKPLLLWINDGLMAVFFFVVGLEIKREIVAGELASPRGAALPIGAAIGGMIAPALLYLAINAGSPGARGWGIPMATDIAFALGALALLGRRIPPSLRVFLAAVAIVDDLGAVLVIAVFYTADVGSIALGVAAILLAALGALNRCGVQHPAPYLLLGLMLWVAVLKSGVHATVAGVLLAMTIPATGAAARRGARRGDAPSPLSQLEHALGPWVAFGIMPLFALANAGVPLSAESGRALLEPVALGVILGLVVGKQAGVGIACWALIRLRWASLPSHATWGQLYGIALLCGIGFTMSLFIATLAFTGGALEHSKIGVLAGSLVAGVAGLLVLARTRTSN